MVDVLQTILDYLTDYGNWLGSLDLWLQIVLGIITVVGAAFLIYYFFYGIGKLLYGIFWLIGTILKAVFSGLAIMFYTLYCVFIKTPIYLICNHTLQEAWDGYSEKIERFLNGVFPPDKKKKEDDKEIPEKVEEKVIEQPQPETPQTFKKEELKQRIQAKCQAFRERITKKVSEFKERRIVQKVPEYHCSTCGATFSPQMHQSLTQNGFAYCEQCGQRFNIENQIPIAIHNP